MSNLVDSHCHLNSPELREDVEEILDRAENIGIRRMLVVGNDRATSIEACELAKKYISRGIYAAVGVHPHEASGLSEEIRAELECLAERAEVVAIGEAGLDYYYDLSPRKVQQEVLAWQIHWARRTGKPLVIHVRDAFDDLFELLRKERGDEIRAVLHCFSGSWEDAKKVLDLGYYLAFGGMLTFKRNDALRSTAARVPLDRVLCETDSPYLAPVPMRGRINEPSYVRYVYEMLADVREMDIHDMAGQIWNNSCELFGWES